MKSLWIAVGVGAMVVAWWLAFRDMRLAGRLMLGLEAAAVAGIVVLCVSILLQVRPGMSDTIATFQPSANFGGWSGLGFGMVFCVLSFGGFEGAATLGEETHDPRRNIPIALLATVLGSGLFFTFVAYCEVVGFGGVGIKELAKSEAPLNDLALRYASPRLAIALDLAAAISCFSGMLGALAAAGRVLFALGRGGLAPSLGEVHAVHGTPAPAVSMSAFLVLLPFVLWGPFIGAAKLLQLHEHPRGARLDSGVHQRGCGGDRRGVARAAAGVVGGLCARAGLASVGFVQEHLSRAGFSEQSMAVRRAGVGGRFLGSHEAAACVGQRAVAGLPMRAKSA